MPNTRHNYARHRKQDRFVNRLLIATIMILHSKAVQRRQWLRAMRTQETQTNVQSQA